MPMSDIFGIPVVESKVLPSGNLLVAPRGFLEVHTGEIGWWVDSCEWCGSYGPDHGTVHRQCAANTIVYYSLLKTMGREYAEERRKAWKVQNHAQWQADTITMRAQMRVSLGVTGREAYRAVWG